MVTEKNIKVERFTDAMMTDSKLWHCLTWPFELDDLKKSIINVE